MQTYTKNSHFRGYIVDSARLRQAMQSRGISSIEELAAALQLHRNTLTPYFQGDRALPASLDSMLAFLEIPASEVLIRNAAVRQQAGLQLAPLISQLIKAQPGNAYIIYGSRAKGTSRKYSDYDIGVYSTGSLPFKQFSKLIDAAVEWSRERSYDVNLTNLKLSNVEFFSELRGHWSFLGGDFLSWIELQKKAGVSLYA